VCLIIFRKMFVNKATYVFTEHQHLWDLSLFIGMRIILHYVHNARMSFTP